MILQSAATTLTMSANSLRSSSIRNDSFLDDEALRLSESGAFDDLEFFLEDGPNPDEPLLTFTDSRSSADLDAFLRDSRGSLSMDFELEALKNSMNSMKLDALKNSTNSMKVDVIHAGGDNMAMPVNMSELTTSAGSGGRPASRGHIIRDRSTSPQKTSRQRRFHLNAVEFDPPSEREQQAGRGDQPPAVPSSSEASRDDQPPAPPSSDAQYSDALQKLAESMKRTGESRRHVMMQRDMLTPAQLRALSLAMERLKHHPGSQQQLQVATPQSHADAPMSISPRSSVVAAFFSGSRGTLTNGLEQSRKQLRAYMGSVNRQPL